MLDSRWLSRLLLGAVLMAAALAAAGASTGAIRSDPGQKVEVNGHQLVLRCTGSGSPTIVIEPGLTDAVSAWLQTLGRLAAARARRCTYDRYGQGGSDVPAGTVTRTIEEVAAEKHDLLAAAGVTGPFILVSGSIGGLIDRYYMKAYPNEIAGAVMVDTAPDDWNLYIHHNTFQEANVVFEVATASESLRTSDWIGNKPVAVIESDFTGPLANKKYWHKRQQALAKISSNSIFFVATSTDHFIELENPALVAKTIKLVVASARTHKRLPSCRAANLKRLGARC